MEPGADVAIFVNLVGKIFALRHGKSLPRKKFRLAREKANAIYPMRFASAISAFTSRPPPPRPCAHGATVIERISARCVPYRWSAPQPMIRPSSSSTMKSRTFSQISGNVRGSNVPSPE